MPPLAPPAQQEAFVFEKVSISGLFEESLGHGVVDVQLARCQVDLTFSKGPFWERLAQK